MNIIVALPVHPNPNVQRPVRKLLAAHPRIRLLSPLEYIPFLALMRRAYLILTDSGGVQEEAPSLGVPVLVLRKTTERPEAAEAGLARIIGTDPNAIVEHVEELLRRRAGLPPDDDCDKPLRRRTGEPTDPRSAEELEMRAAFACRGPFVLASTAPDDKPREPESAYLIPKDIGLLPDAMQRATDYKAAFTSGNHGTDGSIRRRV